MVQPRTPPRWNRPDGTSRRSQRHRCGDDQETRHHTRRRVRWPSSPLQRRHPKAAGSPDRRLDQPTERQVRTDINQTRLLTNLMTTGVPESLTRSGLTTGGVDVKVGQYVTLEGAEVINAPDNALYTHSYIFNFGIPFKHTGIMTTTHVNPMLDIYAGVDTGVNTTFGNHFNCFNCGDNNTAAAFHGGIGLNLLDGALTVV